MTCDYMRLTAAAELIPERPHVSTLRRWTKQGVRGVRLKSCLIGGRRYTSKLWLDEFVVAVSQSGEQTGDSTVCEPTGRNLAARANAAVEELERDGI